MNWSTIILVLCGLCCVQCKHAPTQLIADLQAHFHPGCVFILYSQKSSMELITLWTRLARILIVGNIRLDMFLDEPIQNCTSPLYVIVDDHQHILEEISAAEMFSKARWIVLKQKEPWFDSLNIPFDCEFLVLEKTHLEEVYRISPDFPLLHKKFGDLEPKTWPQFGLYTRRNNLQGYVMRTAVLNDGILMKTNQTGSSCGLGGYFGEIWCILEEMLNFTSDFHDSVDGGTGSEVNGSWDGMVGMIVKGDVMMSASSFLITTKRMTAVDLTQGLAEGGNRVYIRKPDNYLLPWSNSLDPFSARLWFCIVATIFLLTIFLAAITFVTSHSGILHDREFNITNSWLYVFGIFSQQGHDVCPLSLSGRIVYLFSYLCAVVLLAGFAGNYISYLTAGRPLTLPFHSYEELLKDGTYKVGAIPKSAQIDIFRNATDQLFKDIYEKLVRPDISNLPHTYYEGVQRMCKSKYAFVTSAVLMKKFSANSSCEIMDVPGTYMPGMSAMAARKKCPFFGIVNFSLQKMRDGALLKIIEERTLKINKYSQQKDWASISLNEVIPNFSVFILGVLLSVFFVIAECFVSWIIRRQFTNTQSFLENDHYESYSYQNMRYWN